MRMAPPTVICMTVPSTELAPPTVICVTVPSTELKEDRRCGATRRRWWAPNYFLLSHNLGPPGHLRGTVQGSPRDAQSIRSEVMQPRGLKES